MVKTSQQTVGLAADDSGSSSESDTGSNSSDSADIPTSLDKLKGLTAAKHDKLKGLTAAKQDASLAMDTDSGVDCESGLAVDADDKDVTLASSSSSDDDEPLRLEGDVALHVHDDEESDSNPLLLDDEGPPAQAEGDWEPGVNMGKWGSTQSEGFGPDAQAMLANICLKVKRIPGKVRKHILSHVGMAGLGGSIWQLAGALVCLSSTTIHKWFTRVKENSWALIRPRGRYKTRQIAIQTGKGDETQNLVRLCLSSASEGRSLREYERDVARYALAGGVIGNNNYTRQFAREAQHVGATLLRLLDAEDLKMILPGIGIPSDFAVMFDGVSLDKGMFSRHGSVLMLAGSMISPHTFHLCTRMLDAPAMGVQCHTGPALRDLVLRSLCSQIVGLSLEELRSRLSAVGGDGQIVAGGEDARHGSSKAADLLWSFLHSDTDILCVLWDLFHRTDTGAMRAVRACPMAVEVFDVAAALDSQFGVNEGRHMFKGIAEMLNTEVRTVRGLAGTTRKIVAHSSVPRNLLHNYQIYVAALHGRLAWKQSGHGKQSLSSLISMGRRLCDVSFVSFLWFFADMLELIVSPYALIVQGASEPASLQAAERKVLADIDAALVALDQVKETLCVVVLTAQHMHPASWLAHIPIWRQQPMGRKFPTFFRHVLDVLRHSSPSFAGTKLHVPLDPKRADKTMCYGPHCQCVSNTQSGIRADRVRIDIRLGRRKRKRRLMVPRWVAEGPDGGLTPGEWTTPRVQFRPVTQRMPLGWSSNGMFRKGIRLIPESHPCLHVGLQWHQDNWKGTCWCRWNSRCHVPESLYVTHAEINKGIENARQFLKALQKEMTQILGSVGINAGMKELLDSAAVCWDWNYLIEHKPEVRHVQAFLRVARLLKPFLQHTIMPDPRQFPHAQLSMQDSDDVLAKQYSMLLRRVRSVAGHSSMPRRLGPPTHVVEKAQSWQKLKSYSVLPVYCFAIVYELLKVKCPTADWPSMLFAQMIRRIAFIMSQCLGELDEKALPQAAYVPFKVKPKELWVAGERRTRKREKSSAKVHGVYALCWIKKAEHRRLVLILLRNYETSAADVGALFDAEPWFSNGSSNSTMCCWKAVRIHHRCRVLYPVQAVCERLGSFAHSLFEAGQHLTPGPLVDRVLLASSHVWCCGGERDEWLVRETANVLEHVFRKNACVNAKRARSTQGLPQSSQVREHLNILQQSGRSTTDMGVTWEDFTNQISGGLRGKNAWALRQENFRNYVPCDLPPVVDAAVRQSRAKNGDIAMALPVTVGDLHHTQRRWSDSSKSAYLQEWLESADGKTWMAERAALFQCDDS